MCCLPNERIDVLNPKGMRIIQDPAAPCFGIDAVLLADFAEVFPGSKGLDLGTGTGIIPLLLYAKCPQCRLWGIELMAKMADMAMRSIRLNQLEQDIQIIQGDLRLLSQQVPEDSFDFVTANPPYFKTNTGKVSQDTLRAAARSERFCTLADIFAAAMYSLKPKGALFMIHRAERKKEILSFACKEQMQLASLRMIRPYAEAEANLMLVKFIKYGVGETKQKQDLIVYQGKQQYSEEMEAIYRGRK